MPFAMPMEVTAKSLQRDHALKAQSINIEIPDIVASGSLKEDGARVSSPGGAEYGVQKETRQGMDSPPSLSLWMGHFPDAELEQQFQETQAELRRTVVLCVCLAFAAQDCFSGVQGTLEHGVTARTTQREIPPIFWLVDCCLHVTLAACALFGCVSIQRRITPVVSIWLVLRFSVINILSHIHLDLDEDAVSLHVQASIAAIGPVLCVPVGFAAVSINFNAIVLAASILAGTSLVYLSKYFLEAWSILVFVLALTFVTLVIAYNVLRITRHNFMHARLCLYQQEERNAQELAIELSANKLAGETSLRQFNEAKARMLHESNELEKKQHEAEHNAVFHQLAMETAHSELALEREKALEVKSSLVHKQHQTEKKALAAVNHGDS